MDSIARLAAPVDEQDHARGQDSAPVTVVEYADFACPHSGQLYHVLRQLQDNLGDTFRLVYRHFPITQVRPDALPAALAGEAASLQGRFWEMHDLLFERQDDLEPEYLIVYAQVLGLDVEHFILDMTSDRTAAAVRADFVSGIHSGVDGTPTLFINDRRYEAPYDYVALKSAIEQAAAEASAKRHRATTRR